jgi:hypothetical protein
MTQKTDNQDTCRAMAEEERIQRKTDAAGRRWKKMYFGGGNHFRNWRQQYLEVYGRDNVLIEEADARGLPCYTEGGEKAYRIWVRDRD